MRTGEETLPAQRTLTMEEREAVVEYLTGKYILDPVALPDEQVDEETDG